MNEYHRNTIFGFIIVVQTAQVEKIYNMGFGWYDGAFASTVSGDPCSGGGDRDGGR